MTDVSKIWAQETVSKMFEVGECPDYNLLVKYSNGKLEKDANHIIENHLSDCQLCNTVVEGMENCIDTEVDLASAEVMKALKNNASLSETETNSEVTQKDNIFTPLLNLITKTPSIRYSFSVAASIAVVLVIGYQALKPDYYSLASLNDQEKEMVLLSVDNFRGDENNTASELDLSHLLKNEDAILGIIPSFDLEKVNNSLKLIEDAYSSENDSFYKEKYAYFLGKLSLMKEDVKSAEKWFNTVTEFNSETLYSKFAAEILEELK